MTRVSAPRPIRLEPALMQWRRLLGRDRVRTDPKVLDRYARTTLARAPRMLAVIRPGRAEQLPRLVRIARDNGMSLYPISRGKNWGWGEACPVTAGQVVLDLGDINRILEINAELGYAVVEPGVTQGQLARALVSRAPGWWFESTNAGPGTSVVGNALDRGLGMSDRTASVCGLEAVLPNGQILRTGFGIFPRSRVTHLAKWGVGPSLDGLFSQSNLGVVTRMGVWLAQRPRGAECCLISVAAPALPRLIDALRPLRLGGILATNIHIFSVQGRDDGSRWLAVGVVYGTAGARAAHRSAIRAATAGFGKSLYFDTAPRNAHAALKKLEVQPAPGIQDLFRAGGALYTGKPFSPSAQFMLTYLGGPQIQNIRHRPRSADPLDNDYGLYFLWVTCPAVGREVRAALRLDTETSAKFGIRPQLTIQLPNWRAAVLVVRLCFDRRDGAERQRASRCYRAVLKATVRAGFPPWCVGIEGMSLLRQQEIDMDFARRLKAWMDPDGTLAPGRYVWPLDHR